MGIIIEQSDIVDSMDDPHRGNLQGMLGIAQITRGMNKELSLELPGKVRAELYLVLKSGDIDLYNEYRAKFYECGIKV